MASQAQRWFVGVVFVVIGMLVLGSPSAARADHTWTYNQLSLQVLAPSTQGLFSFTPPVATGPQYNWSYGVTEVYLQLGGLVWAPTGEKLGGVSTSPTSVPFFMIQNAPIHAMNADPHGTDLVIDAVLNHYVDAAGTGHFDITNITWGTFWLGVIQYNVTGIAADGWVDVVPVPEPAGILMLLSGAGMLGLVAVRRRRR